MRGIGKPFIGVFATLALAGALFGVPSPARAQASDEFLGQLMYVGFGFAPKGWALCNGQTLSISQNAALFSLLGTQFGGNGVNNFALPDMRGRTPVGMGQGPGLSSYVMGQASGAESVSLTSSQMPPHLHSLSLSAPVAASSGTATSAAPAGLVLANTGRTPMYTASAPNVSLSSVVTVSGNTSTVGGSPLSILPPYYTVNCVIALVGIFPSRN